MNKTIYYLILHLLGVITLGYVLFSCTPNDGNNVKCINTIDSLQIKLDGTRVELQQCKDYVKFLESDNIMLRKGIMLEYEELHK